MKDNNVSVYEWLKAHDVYTWLEPLWSSGRWVVRPDGKLEAARTHVAIDTPWLHHGKTDWANCLLWSSLMFHIVSRRISTFFSDMKPFVPSGCQNCYKVVVRPKTIVQLFALRDLQKQLDLPAKCGTEIRSSVHGLYGGYFYNKGLDAGKQCYELVREAINNDTHLGLDVPVILKRACTEMEHCVGASNNWTVTEEQSVVESLIERWTHIEVSNVIQPDPIIWRIQREWIDYAYAHGDSTYVKLTNGKAPVPGYITYH